MSKERRRPRAIFAQSEGEMNNATQLLAEIDQQRTLFNSVLSALRDLVYVIDRDGRFVYANRALLDIWGLSVDEAIGKTMAELKYPKDVEAQLLSDVRRVIDTNQAVTSLTHYISPTAASGYHENILAPVPSKNGVVELVAGTSRDVTERKLAEAGNDLLMIEHRRQRELFQRVVKNAPIAIAILKGRDLKYTMVNTAYQAIVGSEVALLGRTYRDIFPAVADRGAEEQLRQVLRSGKPWKVRDFLTEIPGRADLTWWEGEWLPLPDDKGVADSVLVLTWEITERKRAEQALEEAGRRKDEFLATLAHELRNPLAPLCNSLRILRMSGELGPTGGVQPLLAIMERQVDHMVRLVDDLMEVSRITRGQIELRKAPLALATAVQNAVEISRPLIESAGHELIVSLPSQPLIVEADVVRLSQVFANLLNNAAKYTDPGGKIWLTLYGEADEALVSVRDNGVGIPRDMLSRVFDMFTQVDRAAGRAHGGLGIGLALVRSLIGMHSGSVHAHSDGAGRGSEFTVRLPRVHSAFRGRTETEAAPATRDPAALAPSRVLVVDDNRDAADSLGILVRLLFADVHVVYNGAAALAAMQTYKPTVVLLDLGMPGMDGYEVARQVRAKPEHEDVALVAVTGWGQEQDRRRVQASGFDHHLVKPADIGTLQALLLAVIEASSCTAQEGRNDRPVAIGAPRRDFVLMRVN